MRAEVDCGVSVGIYDDVADLLRTVERHLDEGYRRIKLKIEPGQRTSSRCARSASASATSRSRSTRTRRTRVEDAHRLAALDEFDLLLIEQPLPEEDLLGHAELAKAVRTPICLDESITSARAAADAIALGACSIVNIKAGRVGGYLEARRVHDVCAEHGVPVWCGGMLETGLGRAANVALAALPGFTLPGDTSASEPLLRGRTSPSRSCSTTGASRVPTGPGLGVSPIPEQLERFTISGRDDSPCPA